MSALFVVFFPLYLRTNVDSDQYWLVYTQGVHYSFFVIFYIKKQKAQ